MVGRWSFSFGARPIFRGHVSFMECTSWVLFWCMDWIGWDEFVPSKNWIDIGTSTEARVICCCCWIPGIPLWKGLLLKGTLRIPNHQAKPPINHKLITQPITHLQFFVELLAGIHLIAGEIRVLNCSWSFWMCENFFPWCVWSLLHHKDSRIQGSNAQLDAAGNATSNASSFLRFSSLTHVRIRTNDLLMMQNYASDNGERRFFVYHLNSQHMSTVNSFFPMWYLKLPSC